MKDKTTTSYIALNNIRQKIRIGLMLLWVLIMPVTLYYFSPYLPYMGLAMGVISGSVFVFVTQFLISIFFGRIFCGWLCPAGAIQTFSFMAKPKRVNRKVAQWFKFALWLPWLGAWLSLALTSLRIKEVPLKPDFFFQLESGISVARPEAYIVYLSVLTLFLGLSLLLGRRGACHTICWMAPFMVIGQKIAIALKIPGIYIKSKTEKCTSCNRCADVCPMSIEIGKLASNNGSKEARIAHHDCINCLRCIDACPSKTLSLELGIR